MYETNWRLVIVSKEFHWYTVQCGQINRLSNKQLKAYDSYQEKVILWIKTIPFQNNIRPHLVTIVSMAPFAPKSTSKLRSALHFTSRYSFAKIDLNLEILLYDFMVVICHRQFIIILV